MWKRLAFLIPSLGAAFGITAWLALHRPCPLSIRIPCLVVSMLLTGLVGTLLLLTLECSRVVRRKPLQETRALRRQLRPWGLLLGLSLMLLAVLVRVPELFLMPVRPPRTSPLALRTTPPGPLAPEEGHHATTRSAKEEPVVPQKGVLPSLPGEGTPVASAAARRAGEALPAAPRELSQAQGKPELRPELDLEPSHLVLDVKEPRWSGQVEIPFLRNDPDRKLSKDLMKTPEPQTPTQGVPGEEGAPPLRLDRDLSAVWPGTNSFFLGLTSRPLPDENDLETWLSPEARVDGFLLLDPSGDHIPGLTLTVDLPVGKNDSVLFSLTGALLPEQEEVEGGWKPNWNHLTLAYTRRVAGFTSQATFDLAASVGLCADFLHGVEGVADPSGAPKFAPYAAIELAFWRREPIGLLIHLSDSLPVTLLGSSLGVAELSAEIRWDVAKAISFHGGYRMVLLRYNSDTDSQVPESGPLRLGLSGPILGLDFRF